MQSTNDIFQYYYLVLKQKYKYRQIQHCSLLGFFAPSCHMHSQGGLGCILQAACDAVEVPIWSLFAFLLDMHAVFLLALKVFPTKQAVPHGGIQFLMELVKIVINVRLQN